MSITIVMKTAEVKVMEMLGSINDPTGWHAIDFHLANLLEQYKSEYQVKIAVNLIHDLLKDYDGGIFLLGDQSIVVLARNLEKMLLSKLVFQLRYLYMDDPLAYSAEGQENPEFSTTYNLMRMWQPFWDISSRRMAMSIRRPAVSQRAAKAAASARLPDTAMVDENPPELPGALPGMLSASRLAHIEQDLRFTDLSRVLRRQPVCAALPKAPVRRVFDELYIHIAHLRQMLKADVDFLSNRWLFKYLTQILDERMLEMIKQNPSRYLDHPVSLNLNVETLLSSSFADFDAAIPPATKVSIVLEVPVVDIFADLRGFMFAKDEAQKLGYRVCVDGLSAGSLAHIDRDALGVDLLKVQWNAAGAGDLSTPENRQFASAVQAAGTNRVILCRCDSLQAVEFGHALGISLFQGRYLDSVIDPTAKVEN